MKWRILCLWIFLAVAALSSPVMAEPVHATLFKNPECSCCEGYASYLREHGFVVDVKPTNNLTEISRKAGVPEQFQGCHTMSVNGYVVDGHVPVNIVRKMLTEKPAIAGITLPGMPMGSPGMSGAKTSTFTIYSVTKDGAPPKVYATE